VQVRILKAATLSRETNVTTPNEIVFEHACKLGCEGIVSKRLGSPYRSGRSPHWLRSKSRGAGRQTRGRGEMGI